MSISAQQVNELRKRTGAGLMECKTILKDVNGDIEEAIKKLRERGTVKAEKKSTQVAAEGAVLLAQAGRVGVIAEFNCQTDFVARDTNFVQFAEAVTAAAIKTRAPDVAALSEQVIQHEGAAVTVEAARQSLVMKIGENIQLRRFEIREAPEGGILGTYSHGGRIGVLVILQGGDDALAKDMAMHIAASSPEAISSDQLSSELLQKEREIYEVQVAESGKPKDILEKMVEGRMRKFVQEHTLLGQIFVKDNPNGLTVSQILDQKKAKVMAFVRYQVGEGIEKKTENFAEEVMAQVKSAG